MGVTFICHGDLLPMIRACETRTLILTHDHCCFCCIQPLPIELQFPLVVRITAARLQWMVLIIPCCSSADCYCIHLQLPSYSPLAMTSPSRNSSRHLVGEQAKLERYEMRLMIFHLSLSLPVPSQVLAGLSFGSGITPPTSEHNVQTSELPLLFQDHSHGIFIIV